MRYLVLASLFPLLLVIQTSYADAGVVVPGVNNTVTQYCLNGVCSTGGYQNVLNATIGEYAYGNYPNGIELNQSHKIAIIESKTCEILLSNNMSSNCIPYNKVWSLDTTLKPFAGVLVCDTWCHRGPSMVKNFDRFNPNWIVGVDPDADFTTQALTITLTNTNNTFANPDDISLGGLQTITHVNQLVTGCTEAQISPIGGKNFTQTLWLINDTIKYFESGCTIKQYNDTRITNHPDIPFYMKSYNIIQQNWLNHYGNYTKMPNCITGCKSTLNQQDPFHSHDRKFGW